MLTEEQITAILEAGYEQRAVEFKGSGNRTDKPFFILVARALMALANQRDGGHVIVGLSEHGIDAEQSGLSDEQLQEWLSYDDVSDQVNAYADPPLRLQVQQRALPNQRPVVVIEVAEFDEVPVLCKKDYQGKLAAGQLYTRSMAKPESSAFNTQNELREVLALATEKQLARFIETSRRAGVNIGLDDAQTASDAFREQASTVEGSSEFYLLSDEPHFIVLIHPPQFEKEAVPFEQLEPIARSAMVQWRGSSFPVVQNPYSGSDWIGEASSWIRHGEVWQFFESGLFVDFQELGSWDADFTGAMPEDTIKDYLPTWLPLRYFTEALEFAARLQKALTPERSLVVTVELNHIEGRALVTGNPNRQSFYANYIYRSESWSREVLVTPELALTGTRDLAVDLCMHLFRRFGWKGVSEEILQSIQVEMFGERQTV